MVSQEPPRAELAAERSFERIAIGDFTTLEHTITQADVDAFVDLTGDNNPLHVSAEFAKGAHFRKPVVHGMLSAAFISTAIGTRLPGSGSLWTSQTLEFIRPAYVGDRITVTATVVQRSAAARVLVLSTSVKNQSGHELIRGQAQVKVLETQDREQSYSCAPASRVILVTGAGGGIGAAVARMLGRQGHQVALNFHRSRGLTDTVVNELAAEGHVALAVQGDVADQASVVSMFEQIEAELGAVDDVVHCASPLANPIPFETVTWAQIQAHLDTQVRGAFHCAQACLPGMVRRGSGSLLFMGSVVAEGTPPVHQSAYVLAKAALTALARSLAVEYGPRGIRINVIAPGMTQTDAIAQFSDKARLLAKMQSSLRRLAEPDDIAHVAAFLIGPGARHITGDVIRVSGGS